MTPPCPYYHADGETFIRCTGEVKGTTARIDFADEDRRPDAAAKRKHYTTFCCKHWKYCAHVQAVRCVLHGVTINSEEENPAETPAPCASSSRKSRT